MVLYKKRLTEAARRRIMSSSHRGNIPSDRCHPLHSRRTHRQKICTKFRRLPGAINRELDMIRLTASKAREDFASIIKGVRMGERFLLCRHGEDVAAVVSVEDLALLQAIDDRHDAEAARAALAEVEEK